MNRILQVVVLPMGRQGSLSCLLQPLHTCTYLESKLLRPATVATRTTSVQHQQTLRHSSSVIIIPKKYNQLQSTSSSCSLLQCQKVQTFSTSVSDKSQIEQFLEDNEISVRAAPGSTTPSPILEFEGSNLPSNILEKVLDQFNKPTPIQSQALPIALSGSNMVGIGQTGSGKTLAFLLPALVHIQNSRQSNPEQTQTRNNSRGPIALVLTPTRELAKQIQEVAQIYRRSTRVTNVCCIGGESKYNQLRQYDRGPELMIATPGRLKDFLASGMMSVSEVDYVVLDEADRMLDMGFEPQIRTILSNTRPQKQVLMFSATWPEEVKELAEDYLNDYTFMNIGSLELSANKNIKQEFIFCDSMERHKQFVEKIMSLGDSKVLIFAERKSTVDYIERILRRKDIPAMGIHGDKSQERRSKVIYAFKTGHCSMMIATDVAARGLDISGVEYVVNYDFPLDFENYVHRIGRTGRSTNKGTAITFMTEDDGSSTANKLIKVLKEAEQVVPEELYTLSKFGKENARMAKRRGGQAGQRRYDGGYRDRLDRGTPRGYNRNYDNDSSRGEFGARSNSYQHNRARRWRNDDFYDSYSSRDEESYDVKKNRNNRRRSDDFDVFT